MAVTAALLYLLTHAVMSAFLPQPLLPSLTLTAVAPLLAALACLWRWRLEASANEWLASAIAMLLWALGAISSLYVEAAQTPDPRVADIGIVAFFLYAVPIGLVLARASHERWYSRAIDSVLLALLGVLFFVHVHAQVGTTPVADDATARLRSMFDLYNGFLAIFALLRLAGAEHPRERSFLRSLSVFATTYFVAAMVVNRASGEFPREWLHVLLDAPFLLLAVLALRARVPERRRSADRLTRLMQGSRPMILPICLLAIASMHAYHSPTLAIVGFVAATLGVGARGALQQSGLLQRHEALGAMAMQDGLTGIANRRRFDKVLQEELARARRTAAPLALLMIDVDHFKQYNDQHGHPLGDQCLRAVASKLSESAARATDLVARYGGEEFAVILSHTAPAGALDVAERMRAGIEGLASPALPAATISIGIACLGDMPAASADALVTAADAALYGAKRRGRNRVVVHGSPPESGTRGNAEHVGIPATTE